MQYMGSKNRISKHIVPIIQSYITEDTKGYLETFVGGANVIDKIECKNKIGCDVHEYLIELLKHVQEKSDDVPLHITEEEYYEVRDNTWEYPKWYVGLVGFCGSYGSMFFQSFAKGNDTRDRQNEAIRNILKQASNLKNIKFKCCDFRNIPKDKINGYVIYCDPPYKNTASYKTGDFPYEEYYQWCKDMSKNNIVLCSEYWMPEDDFECIWKKETTTQISSKRIAGSEKNIRIERLYICKPKEK